MKSVTIVAGLAPREAVIAVTRRLAHDRQEKVNCLYPQPIAGVPGLGEFHTSIEPLENLEDSFVVGLSPEALGALRKVKQFKKALGAEALSQHFCTHPGMADAFVRQAGGDMLGGDVTEQRNPLRVAFWVAGKHLVQAIRTKKDDANKPASCPLAFAYKEIRGLMPKGGPPYPQGIMLLPCWSKRLTKVAEAIRLACMSVGYSGLVFVDLFCPPRPEEHFQIQEIKFSIPQGFMTAFLALLDQPFDKFLYEGIWKGAFFRPKIHCQAAVALRVVEECGMAYAFHQSPLLSTPGGIPPFDDTRFMESYHAWRTDYSQPIPTELPEELWVEYPTAQVKLDGFSSLQYTLKELEEQRVTLAQRQSEVTVSVEDNNSVKVPNEKEEVTCP